MYLSDQTTRCVNFLFFAHRTMHCALYSVFLVCCRVQKAKYKILCAMHCALQCIVSCCAHLHSLYFEECKKTKYLYKYKFSFLPNTLCNAPYIVSCTVALIVFCRVHMEKDKGVFDHFQGWMMMYWSLVFQTQSCKKHQ